jgi:hypothetical protein
MPLLQAHQLGQHHGARHDRNMFFAGGDHFRIVGLHRGRRHHRVGAFDVFGGMAAACTLRAEIRPGARVARYCCRGRSRTRIAEVEQHLGDAAHAAAADADEMDVLDFVFHAVFHQFFQYVRNRGVGVASAVF